MIPHFSMLNDHFLFLHSVFHSRKSTPLKKKKNSQKILTRRRTIVLRNHESADDSQFHAHNRGLYWGCVCVCVCAGVGGGEPLLAPTLAIQQKFQTPGISAELMICGKAEASCGAVEHLARVSRRPDLGTPWNPWHLSWLPGWTAAISCDGLRQERAKQPGMNTA